MRFIKVLALGLIVAIVTLGIWVAAAFFDDDEPAILQKSSPTPQVMASTVTPVTATPTPRPNPTATAALSPTPLATSTPTPAPPTLLVPTVVPLEVKFGDGIGYSMDTGVVVRAAPKSGSQQVATLDFWEEVQIARVVDGQMWFNYNQYISPFGSFAKTVDDWYELKEGGYVYSAFIFVPKEGEASPFVSGKRWVEVDRDDQVIHAYVDGKERGISSTGWCWTALDAYTARRVRGAD